MNKPERVTAADKTLLVLEAAIDHPRFTDIVEVTALSKTTVHRILRTLMDHDFLTQTEEGHYTAGPRALSLASRAFTNIDISEIARPYLESLVQRTGFQAHLGAPNGSEAIYLAIIEADKPYSIPSAVGRTLPLHTSAMGKLFLANASETHLKNYLLDPGLFPRTPHSFTDADLFKKELQKIKENGFAIDDEENVPGIRCIGAPVRDHTGHVTHAISLTTLALETSTAQLEKTAPAEIEIANAISHALGWEESK